MFIMDFFLNFDQPLGNLLHTSLGMMQLQLEEGGFRATGEVWWVGATGTCNVCKAQ